MKVVFLEEVEGTARTGDVKNVAGGFARNYLLPRKLAAPATAHYINIAQQKATKEGRRQVKLDDEAQKLVPQVDGKEITIEVRVGDQDKMFGSVTARDIAESLAELTKIDLEHRQIDLRQPIRELGAPPGEGEADPQRARHRNRPRRTDRRPAQGRSRGGSAGRG